MPLLIPAIGDRLDPDQLIDRIDGLMVTGSPSNVDPSHYGGPPRARATRPTRPAMPPPCR